jgi:hypothetical protein
LSLVGDIIKESRQAFWADFKSKTLLSLRCIIFRTQRWLNMAIQRMR